MVHHVVTARIAATVVIVATGRGATALRVEVRGPSDGLATLASDLSERLRGANRLECNP